MARRLTLEGAKVCGVYEAKPTPSGLTRNIMQCLTDFDIPLFLSHTVTKVFGEDRLTKVEISKVDEKMRPIAGSEQIIECDALILSVGLIPENELAESMEVKMDDRTKGPVCDNAFMTNVEGIFSCGNALHVNDLADYVSESGELAGRAAAKYEYKKTSLINITANQNFLYLVPQRYDIDTKGKTILYFRSREILKKAHFSIKINQELVFEKKYQYLKPPEMEKLEFDFSKYDLSGNSKIEVDVEEEP